MAVAMLDRPPEAEREQVEALDALARERLDVYGHRVHGIRPARHHREWLEPLQAIERGELQRLLIIAPPGGAKSTWVSLTFVPWYLGNHPDQSVLFFTSSDAMARRFGTTIKWVLDANEAHEQIFGKEDCRPDEARGWSSETGMYLKATPRSGKDPAFASVSFLTRSIGARAHGIVLDDPLDQSQCESEAIMDQARDYFDGTIAPRLHRGQHSWIVAIMTSWNERDFAHFLAGKPAFQEVLRLA